MSATSVCSSTVLQQIQSLLVRLKLARSLEVLDDLVSRLESGELSALEMLQHLLSEEQSAREQRSLQSASMTARLTRVKTLDGFDFFPAVPGPQSHPVAGRAGVHRPRRGGPPARTAGDRQVASAIALGFEAIRAGKSVFFATLAEIIASLIKAQRDGELAARLRYLARPSLLIVDEVGYLPLEPGGANLFFQLVNVRYEKGAMILTSNRGFRGWGQVFGDNVIAAALLDRLLRHAIVIEIHGSSYRLREHAHLMPEALHPTPVSTPPKRRPGRPRKTEVPPSFNG